MLRDKCILVFVEGKSKGNGVIAYLKGVDCNLEM